MAQGGVNVGGWVLKSGGRPPGAALAEYQAQVGALLQWECETLVPSHGDVLRGGPACRAALQRHFMPTQSRSGTPEPEPGTRGFNGGNNYVFPGMPT